MEDSNRFTFRRGRSLPHLTKDAGTYAVTFRLSDSLPANVVTGMIEERDELRSLLEQGRINPEEKKKLRHLEHSFVAEYLDKGAGSCVLRKPEAARIVLDALFHNATNAITLCHPLILEPVALPAVSKTEGRYVLHALAIMPNHVHSVITMLSRMNLENTFRNIKRYTSREINGLENQRGREFWQRETYDHLIEDGTDLLQQIEYTLRNPREAGMQHWPWLLWDPGAVLRALMELDQMDAENAARMISYLQKRL